MVDVVDECVSEPELNALAGRGLSPGQADRVDEHLARCASCRGLAVALARSRATVVPAETEAPAVVDRSLYDRGPTIARGGMGHIYSARDRRLNRRVAIKELRTLDARLVARFEREIRLTARLQHPSIVSIHEAGTWTTGEPFYAMKLVDGRTFAKVIDACTSLDARLALIPNVIAAVEALAYAHDNRIIHRDLKPSNILVGDFGETVVIDWGLAKDLAEAGDDTAVTAPDRDVAPPVTTETVAGTVLGTPSYMPPEQASGEPVDERADVYALGAILFHVLVGEAPFTGKSSEEIIARVRARPPDGRGPLLRLAATGAPRDLITIVEKAMARSPEDRYSNAQALARDLEHYRTGQLVGAHRYTTWQLVRRWMRRHRAPLAVAGIAAVALGVVGVLGLRGVLRARQRAETNRRGAEDAMLFMLGDMHDRLRPLGRTDLLEPIAKQAVAYYDGRDELTDVERAHQALALRSLADVYADRGRTDQAIALDTRAIAIAEELARAAPTDLERQRDLRNALHGRSVARYRTDDDQGALVDARAAAALEARVRTIAPDDHAWEWYAARTHYVIARTLRDAGDAAGCLRELELVVAACNTAIARGPDPEIFVDVDGKTSRADLEWHVTLGSAERVTAYARSDLGEAARAVASARASLAENELVAKAEPTGLHEAAVMAAHNSLATMLQHGGTTDEQLAEIRAAITGYERLQRGDPDNAHYRDQLLTIQLQLDATLRKRGDLPGALAAAHTAVELGEGLLARDAGNPAYQESLASARRGLGAVLDQMGDTAGAIAEQRAAADLLRSAFADDPQNARGRRLLQAAELQLGSALERSGDLAGALASYRDCLAIAESLAAAAPDNVDAVADLSNAYANVGDVERQRHDVPAALAAYRAAIAAAAQASARQPNNTDYAIELAVAHDHAGTLLLDSDPRAARAEYEAFRAIIEPLAKADPANHLYALDVGWAHAGLAAAANALGDVALAAVEARAALAAIPSDATSGDDAELLQDAHGQLARSLADAGSPAEAVRELATAVAIAEAAAVKAPDDVAWPTRIATLRAAQGHLALDRGDAATALAAYRDALARRAAAKAGTISAGQLAECHIGIGRALAAGGDLAGAARELETVTEGRAGEAQLWLATVKLARRDGAGAVAEARTALAALDANAAAHTNVAEDQILRAQDEAVLADVLAATGDAAAAAAARARAHELIAPLAAAYPANARVQRLAR